MNSVISSFLLKATTLLVCIFLFGINTANAKFDYPGKLNADCASVAGWIQLSDPFAGGNIDDCVVCHNPSGPDNDRTSVMNLDPKPRFSTAVCMAVIAEKNPAVCTDNDGDGYYIETDCPMRLGGPIDCNDNNAAVFPGATEICTDGIDNNCDSLIDTQDTANCPVIGSCTDVDSDGYYLEANCPMRPNGPIDCDDTNAAINPGAVEICADKIDNNCNGMIDLADPAVDRNTCPVDCIDEDKDGYSITGGEFCGPIDCNDNNAAINPGAEELCSDNVDNNCNGMVDNADQACPIMMDPKAKLKELKAKLKAHEKECEAKKKQLEREYESLKKKLKKEKKERKKRKEDKDEEDEEDVEDEEDEEDEDDD
ncbi:MAG: putative metal-binding motif-containing protein [Gammaproteobacteria bacterium]